MQTESRIAPQLILRRVNLVAGPGPRSSELRPETELVSIGHNTRDPHAAPHDLPSSAVFEGGPDARELTSVSTKVPRVDLLLCVPRHAPPFPGLEKATLPTVSHEPSTNRNRKAAPCVASGVPREDKPSRNNRRKPWSARGRKMNLEESVPDRDQLCYLLTATASCRLSQKNSAESASCSCASGTSHLTKPQLCFELAGKSPVKPPSRNVCRLGALPKPPNLPADTRPAQVDSSGTGAATPATDTPSRSPTMVANVSTSKTRSPLEERTSSPATGGSSRPHPVERPGKLAETK